MEQSNTAKGKLRYIGGIDGLRAVAVFMVLAYHLHMPFAKGGLLGVTVFFVISGFLITRILLDELYKTDTIDLKNFWKRRLRRLLPAVLTMITFLILVSAAVNRVLFTKAAADVWSVIFSFNNWWQIFNKVSYFENAGAPSPLTHCWSLSIEMQFYLVYPVLLIAFSRFRNRKKIMMGVVAVLACLSVACMWLLFDPAQDPSRVYYGTDTRAFSLLFGALLAMKTQGINITKRFSATFCNVISVILLTGLAYLMIFVDGYSSFLYHGGQALASLLAAGLIFTMLHKKSALGRILGTAPFRWAGVRSYGIYLWHYPLILLISGGKASAWWVYLAACALTVVMAALSYRFIETPVRHGAIGRNLAMLHSRPVTKEEIYRKSQALRRSIATGTAVCLLGICVLVCMAVTPRKTMMDDVSAREEQARESERITAEKIAKQKEEMQAQQMTEETAAAGTVISQETEEESLPNQAEQISADQAGQLADKPEEPGQEQSAAALPQYENGILKKYNFLLIGDSIALDVEKDFYALSPDSICDDAISRYTTEGGSIYESYVSDYGWNGSGVIFALGTNGLMYDSLPVLRANMGPDKPLFIMTIRAPYVHWEDTNNAEIREFASSTPNTYVIDWYTASAGHREYFGSDETHLSAIGAQAYADCIAEALLQVYGN